MTESFGLAPLQGQSLRGRPVQEICTPVNEGNCPLRDEGEAVASASALPSGCQSRAATELIGALRGNL